jgi:hypothetical protein
MVSGPLRRSENTYRSTQPPPPPPPLNHRYCGKCHRVGRQPVSAVRIGREVDEECARRVEGWSEGEDNEVWVNADGAGKFRSGPKCDTQKWDGTRPSGLWLENGRRGEVWEGVG